MKKRTREKKFHQFSKDFFAFGERLIEELSISV